MKKLNSKIEVLSENEIQLINNNALRVLSEIGINVPNDEVISMCADCGCEVIYEKQIVRFPVAIMETFIDKMRKDAPKKNVDGPAKLYGKISTQVTLVDYRTNQRRYGLRDDNLKCISLVEKLHNIPFCNAAVVPSDVPYEISDLVSIVDIQKYSIKPGATYILTPVGSKFVQEVNNVLDIRTEYLFETISPLTFKKDTVDMALDIAKNGGKLGVAPMAMSSATAPVTVSGTLVVETAEVLGSGFLVHMMTGEFPGFIASCHTIDLSSTLCSFGSPNQALFGVAAAQLGKFYGIHSATNSGLTDSLVADFQGGFEKGISGVFNALSGSDMIGCQGIVGADQGFSYEQLAMDNDWIDYYNYITKGFEVSEEAIGFDVIKDIGIAGNFLGEDHTIEYMRDNYWKGALNNNLDWANWQNNGSLSITDRAHSFVEKVTKDYKKMEIVIEQQKADELDKILKNAFDEVTNK